MPHLHRNDHFPLNWLAWDKSNCWSRFQSTTSSFWSQRCFSGTRPIEATSNTSSQELFGTDRNLIESICKGRLKESAPSTYQVWSCSIWDYSLWLSILICLLHSREHFEVFQSLLMGRSLFCSRHLVLSLSDAFVDSQKNMIWMFSSMSTLEGSLILKEN